MSPAGHLGDPLAVEAVEPGIAACVEITAEAGQVLRRAFRLVVGRVIRDCVQLGLLPLPKALNPDHMRANAEVDFEIAEADMDML